MPSLRLQIRFEPEGRIGPGKIALLEQVAATGSISAAGRAMNMSYKRAWQLVDDLSQTFEKPVIDRFAGGVNGGGARLTPFGVELVKRYHAIERSATRAAARHLSALQSNVR